MVSDDKKGKHEHLLADAPSAFSAEEFATAKRVLSAIVKDSLTLKDTPKSEQEQLQYLAGRASVLEKDARRKLRRARAKRERERARDKDEDARKNTAMRVLREQPVFVTPPGDSAQLQGGDALEAEKTTFENERTCYVCKEAYKHVHHFYDQLCQSCGDFNFEKRSPSHDLSGRVALVTGARVKIGYHAAIMLLRNGCHVLVTTRFPNDCAKRYAAESDFDSFKDRLDIYGLDLRHTPSVENFCEHLTQTLERLDFVIHNACQTVRRPPEFYAHMLEGEKESAKLLPKAQSLVENYEGLRARMALGDSAQLSQAKSSADAYEGKALPESVRQLVEIFPQGKLDADLQQIDLRTHNSWRLKLDEVPTLELLEVLLVNAVAPFVMSGKLRGLMKRVPSADKHIVNVSAMEGQFNRHKTDKHPHTNMAKAALNMLTRTSAQDYVKDGIHMNAVDTGWITDEDPAHLAQMKVEQHRFSPPLDIIDGAARIVAPIFEGFISGTHTRGQFLKDYKPTFW